MLLFIRKPNGRYAVATDAQVFEQAARLRLQMFPARTKINKPRDLHPLLRDQLAHVEHERFVVVFLNTRHELLTVEHMFRGTIDGATVYPREVVKRALELNASAVVLGHQHPSGVAEPSEADRAITARLSQALGLVEVRLLDHLVVGGDHVVSLAERGWL